MTHTATRPKPVPDGGTESPGYFTAVLAPGNLNGDGKVDIADAAAVLEIMLKQ